MKNKFLKITMFLIFGIGFSQTPISLETAIDKAFKNNLNIKSGTLRIDYQNKMQKSAVIIDPLNISAEIGQMNSFYVDNKFSVSQTIRLPKFYNAQKTLLLEEWKNSLLNLDLQKWQLKREISLIYNELNYFDRKKKLLKKAGLDNQKFTLHCLRHTIATQLLEQGMELEKVRDFLGHEYLGTTQIYTRVNYGNRKLFTK